MKSDIVRTLNPAWNGIVQKIAAKAAWDLGTKERRRPSWLEFAFRPPMPAWRHKESVETPLDWSFADLLATLAYYKVCLVSLLAHPGLPDEAPRVINMLCDENLHL